MDARIDSDLLLQRIEQLERRWRRAWRMALFAVAVVPILLVGWGSSGDLGEKNTERLVIGGEGTFSIVLEATPDAARIVMRDRQQQTRNLVELTDAGIISRIVDRNGRGRFDLLVTDRQIGGLGDNEARLKISDAQGRDAVLLVATSTTQGIVVVDAQGENKTLLTENAPPAKDSE